MPLTCICLPCRHPHPCLSHLKFIFAIFILYMSGLATWQSSFSRRKLHGHIACFTSILFMSSDVRLGYYRNPPLTGNKELGLDKWQFWFHPMRELVFAATSFSRPNCLTWMNFRSIYRSVLWFLAAALSHMTCLLYHIHHL